MHFEATDQSADSADDSTGYYADRCESLNQRLGRYFRTERPHAEKSCGFVCKWPVQDSAEAVAQTTQLPGASIGRWDHTCQTTQFRDTNWDGVVGFPHFRHPSSHHH
jgi:hypothetical protein